MNIYDLFEPVTRAKLSLAFDQGTKVYKCHDTHFHVSVEDWLNCPYTTIQEIIDNATTQ